MSKTSTLPNPSGKTGLRLHVERERSERFYFLFLLFTPSRRENEMKENEFTYIRQKLLLCMN